MTAEHRPALLIALVSALLWGLWWIPIRALMAEGLPDIWGSIAMNLGALPLIAAVAWFWRGGGPLTLRAIGGALLVGVAVTLYSAGLTYTDVVRVVVLFYLAPAWSILIEVGFFGRRWTLTTLLAVAASFGGLFLIVGGEFVSGSFGIGEAMALGAGMAWSAGAALMFSVKGASPGPGLLTLASVVAAVLVGLAIAVLGGFEPPAQITPGAALVAALAGTIYLAPVMLATLWAALRLAPATMSFLLTAEILSGVATSAMFLDEPFGWMEAGGAALVVLGVIIEVQGQKKPQPA